MLVRVHWLPVVSRIQYKVATLCYNSFTESYPVCLSELLTVYHPSRQLRSISNTETFRVAYLSLKQKPLDKIIALSFAGPEQWNLLAQLWCPSFIIRVFFQVSFKNSSFHPCAHARMCVCVDSEYSPVLLNIFFFFFFRGTCITCVCGSQLTKIVC